MNRQFVCTALILGILLVMTIVMLVDVLQNHYILNVFHYMAFLLLSANMVLLFFNYKLAVAGTGIMLVLGVFDIVNFTAVSTVHSVGVGSVSTPYFSYPLLMIFLLYLALHYNVLLNWYWDYKDARKK